ncbi:methyl-accepting chemotaxis protein [Halorientalis brevis]|uniref:Methyl-accepting chemotaxis protein n=1 Tax=Halorientalis brevis TaxID=1126241 RepID=A0ABD6C946_9EURY|nr:methyl-accepting chemotaxis protein [Halorientalis brevis]
MAVTEAQGALANSSEAKMAAEVGNVAENAEMRSELSRSQVQAVREHPAVRDLVAHRYGNETIEERADQYEQGAAYASTLNETREYERTYEFFDEFALQNTDIDSIRVFWRDGNVLAGYKRGNPVRQDYKWDKAWFRTVMDDDAVDDDEVYVSAINVARSTDSPTIRYAMPIHVDGERVGVVIINYESTPLTKPVTHLDLGEEGYGLFVDPDYTNAEGEQLGAAYLANERDPSLAFNESAAGNLTIPTDELVGMDGTFTFTDGGTTWHVQYEQVELAGGRTYYALAVEPMSQILASSRAIREKGILVGGISGVIAIGLGLIVTRRLVTGPITRLTRDAEAVADGEMDHEIRTSDTSAEIGRLTRSVQQMKGNVVDALEQADEQRREAEASQDEAREQRREAQAAKEQAEQLTAHLEAQAETYESVMRACADGDLTQRMRPDDENEAMRSIAEAFNDMVTDWERTVAEIQTFAADVAESGNEVQHSTDSVRDAAGEVSESVQAIADGARQQSENLEQVLDEMNDLSATVEEIASTAETVADTSQETATVTREGKQAGEQALDEMRGVEDTAHRTVERVRALDDQMERIGEITGVIADIAEQTNILALNANIEAARAGQDTDGEGFAVVANEVKQLAEETQSSAAEIESVIADVKAQTDDVVADVVETEDRIADGVETVETAVDAFETVAENVDATDSGVQEIDRATGTQADSTQEIVVTVEDVAAVSEETTAESDNVAAAAEEQSATLETVAETTRTLAEQAADLEALLGQFEVDQDGTADGAIGSETSVAADGRGD